MVVDGRYQQLNANILQIENEYYGTVQIPSRCCRGWRKPVLACRRGVRYIELIAGCERIQIHLG